MPNAIEMGVNVAKIYTKFRFITIIVLHLFDVFLQMFSRFIQIFDKKRPRNKIVFLINHAKADAIFDFLCPD